LPDHHRARGALALAEIVEREPRARCEQRIAAVDDDASSRSDTGRAEHFLERIDRRELVRDAVALDEQRRGLDEPRTGDVSGVVTGTIADVENRHLPLVPLEPVGGDEHLILRPGERGNGNRHDQRKNENDVAIDVRLHGTPPRSFKVAPWRCVTGDAGHIGR
jgi:hypothetical protein